VNSQVDKFIKYTRNGYQTHLCTYTTLTAHVHLMYTRRTLDYRVEYTE